MSKREIRKIAREIREIKAELCKVAHPPALEQHIKDKIDTLGIGYRRGLNVVRDQFMDDPIKFLSELWDDGYDTNAKEVRSVFRKI